MSVAMFSEASVLIDEPDRIRDCLNELHDFELKHDLKLLTKEARMLLLIKNEPRRYLKYYHVKSGLSIRWFGIVIRSLVENGAVKKSNCDKDGRGKFLYSVFFIYSTFTFPPYLLT